MCSCWHQDQYWVILRRSQCIKATIIYATIQIKRFSNLLLLQVWKSTRCWQDKESPALRFYFWYSQDFLELKLRISHEKIQNTLKKCLKSLIPLSLCSLKNMTFWPNYSRIDASVIARTLYSYCKVPALLLNWLFQIFVYHFLYCFVVKIVRAISEKRI